MLDQLASLLPGDEATQRRLLQVAGASTVAGVVLFQLLKNGRDSARAAVDRNIHRIEDTVHRIEDTVHNLQDAIHQRIEHVFDGASHIPTRTPAAALADLAYNQSDVVFVYHVGTADEQAELLTTWQAEQRSNVHGRFPRVQQLDLRAGAAAAVAGAASSITSPIAVLTSSIALPAMAPALTSLAARRQPLAVHVALQQVDSNLHEQLDLTVLALYRDSNFVMIFPLNGQEIPETGALAHLLATQARLPVLHVYDGIFAGRTLCQLPEPPLAAAHSTLVDSRAANSSDAAHDAVEAAHRALARTGAHATDFFTTFGACKDATHVVIFLGTVAPAFASALAAHKNIIDGHSVAAVAVRVFRPWSSRDLCAALPTSTRRITVVEVGQAADGSLLLPDVSATFFSESWTAPQRPSVRLCRLAPGPDGVTVDMALDALRFATRQEGARSETHLTAATDLALSLQSLPRTTAVGVWGHAAVDAVATGVTRTLHQTARTYTAAYLSHDEIALSGVQHGVICASPQSLAALSIQTAKQQSAVVTSSKLMRHLALPIIARLEEGSSITVLDDLDWDMFGDDASPAIKRQIVTRNIQLNVLDLDAAASDLKIRCTDADRALLTALLVAQRLVPHADSSALLAALAAEAGLTQACQTAERLLKHALDHHHRTLVTPNQDTIRLCASEESANAPESAVSFTPRARLVRAAPTSSRPRAVNKAQLAWHFMYKDTYAAQSGARPGHEGVFRVRLTKHQRLTPDEYHRNVFHLEMDITGTGLKYEIGDALGVFGHNDKVEVAEFLDYYGLDGEEVVSIEHPTIASQRELLTIRQLFTERLDLFGKPSQKFYEGLAPFAEDSFQRAKLEWLGTEDKEGFKIRQLESYTYVDILREFDSARPPLDELILMVPPIKPRHYSISSSMKMCPNSVHLLVVLVDWVTPKGRQRYGQCTRYLAGLNPEADGDIYLNVDIKPSAMHLPPSPKQPIIMAGLGTGMAPFRAFIQERMWQRQQGIEVGPVLLYFGSRHRHEEYLYGDFLDAMYEDKLVTRLGLAFSRDQPQKIYIQHKITEDKKDIVRHLYKEEGHFYLCGPTWPVPDIRQAIADGLVAEAGMSEEQVDEFLDMLKENGRYVLEVY